MKIFIDVLITIVTICCCVYLGLNPNLTVSGLSFFIIFIGLLITIHNIIVFFGYIASKSGKRFGKFERKIKQLDKTDLKNIKNYYREIFKDNSPLNLGYLDDFELDNKKIIAELLYLKKKKLINIEDGKIVKLNVIEKLQASEKWILDRIIDGKLKFNDSKLDLRKLVENECKNKDFISKQNSSKGILILMLILKFFLVLIAVSVFVLGLYYLMIKKDSINSIAKYFKRLTEFDWSLIVFAITGLAGSLYYLYIQESIKTPRGAIHGEFVSLISP